MKSYNPFDDISDDEWKAAAKPTPVSSNPFDAISDSEWQAAAVKPKKQKNLFSLGATVRGAARGADNIVGGIEKFVPESRRFFDANKQQVGERLSEPVNFDPFKAFSADPGDYELAKRAATTLGGARVLDSALNFLPNVYDAAMVKPRPVMDALGTAESLGMPIDPLVRSRFQSLPRSRVAQALYANSPEYQRLAEKYPGTFEAQQAVSQTVMPVPGRAGELLGRGSVLNKNFLTRTADAALSQGAIGAGQALENANLKGQEASAGDILAGFAGGAVLGGGFNALGEGAGKVVGEVGERVGAAFDAGMQAFRASAPAPVPVVKPLSGRVAEGVGAIDASFLDEEEQAVMQALGINGANAAPVSASVPASPVEQALQDVETAGPLSLKDAIENAKRQIKEAHPSWDTLGRKESEKKLEAAIALNEDWQLMQANSRGESGRFEPGRYGATNHLSVLTAKHPQQKPNEPGVKYPEYLDLSSSKKETWSLKDYLDVNQSPEGLRFPDYLDLQQEPKAAPTMGQLADDLGGAPAGSVDVDPFEIALARVRNAPNERALQAAIEEAGKLIPKAAPKDYKKLLRGRLNDAYNTYQDRTSGKVLSGGVEEVQAPPAQEPMPEPKRAEVSLSETEDFNPGEVVGRVEGVPEFFVFDDIQKLEASERQEFPKAFEEYKFPGAKKADPLTAKLTGEYQAIVPAWLNQADFEEAFEKFYRFKDLPSMTRSMKQHYRNIFNGLSEERLRRARRVAYGIPLNIREAKEIRELSTDEVMRIIDNGSERQQLQAIEEMVRREGAVQAPAQENPFDAITDEEMKAAGITPETAPISGVRQRLDIAEDGRAMRGHNQGVLGAHIESFSEDILPVEGKAFIEMHAKNKIAKEAAEHVLEALSKGIYERFGDGVTPLKVGKLKINPPKAERRLTLEGQAAKDKARAEYADFVAELKGAKLRAVAGNSPAQYVKVPEIPGNLDDAAALLARAKQEADVASKTYDGLKGEVGAVVEAAHAKLTAADPAGHFAASVPVELADGRTISVKVEHVNQRMEKEFAWEAYEKALKKEPGLQPEEFFAHWEQARAKATGLKPRPISEVILASVENLKKYKQALAAIDAQHGYNKQVPGSVVRASKALLPISTGISAAIEGGGGAMAADGSEQDSKAPNMPVTTALATLAAAGFSAKAIQRIGPARIKAFLSSRLGFLANIYRDTVDHLGVLDAALKMPEDQGIAREVWAHSAGVVQAGFGVKFPSQAAKAHALQLLRDKKISLQDALAGAAGTTFEALSPEARKAVVESYLHMRTLAGKLQQYQQRVDAAVQAGKLDKNTYKESIRALAYAVQALSPNRDSGTWYGDAFSHTAGNAMSAIFDYNVEQYVLNLSDQFIAGAGKVGLGRIAKANVLLMGDAEIRQLFTNSNVLGNFKAEQVEQTIRAADKVLNPRVPELQMSSDRVNADRVLLGSFLQFFDENKERLGVASGADFVKKLLKNELPPDVTMEAWVQAMDNGSRTLGVDPLRLNTDAFTRFKHAPVLSVFVRQPARMARLAANYVANDEWGKLGTMIAMTAILGGSAAVPQEVREAWGRVNPGSYFALSRALDELNLARRLTGYDASTKLGYGFFAPLFATVTPAIETIKTAPEKIEKFMQELKTLEKAGNQDWVQLFSNPSLKAERHKLVQSLASVVTTGAMLIKAKIFGVPVMPAVRVAKAAEASDQGSIPVWMFEPGASKPFAQKREVPVENTRYGNATPFLDLIAPGSPVEARDTYMSELEKARRKKAGASTKPADLSYQDPLLGLSGRR